MITPLSFHFSPPLSISYFTSPPLPPTASSPHHIALGNLPAAGYAFKLSTTKRYRHECTHIHTHIHIFFKLDTMFPAQLSETLKKVFCINFCLFSESECRRRFPLGRMPTERGSRKALLFYKSYKVSTNRQQVCSIISENAYGAERHNDVNKHIHPNVHTDLLVYTQIHMQAQRREYFHIHAYTQLYI